jgi:hypothetical protein|tara:strand:+ start:181 stop:1074 length:894 start_codon:yes stop_codon:yes gene_type:complete
MFRSLEGLIIMNMRKIQWREDENDGDGDSIGDGDGDGVVRVGMDNGVREGIEGDEQHLWLKRKEGLDNDCVISTANMKHGVPRIRIGGNLVNSPRHTAFGRHRARLKELFPRAFESTDSPTAIKLFPLCGCASCVEPDHTVLMFFRHKVELEERRIAEYGNGEHWWSGAEQFYDTYAEIAGGERTADLADVRNKKMQAATRRKLSRRKSRVVSESELEKAVGIVFGNKVSPLTHRQYREIEGSIMNEVRNVIHKVVIAYANRKVAIDSGYVKDHDRPAFSSSPGRHKVNVKDKGGDK